MHVTNWANIFPFFHFETESWRLRHYCLRRSKSPRWGWKKQKRSLNNCLNFPSTLYCDSSTISEHVLHHAEVCSAEGNMLLVTTSEVRSSERGQRSKHQIITLWNGGGGVKPGCVLLWPRAWHNTLKIRTNLSSIHIWPWNPNTRLISVELARHNEAKERIDSEVEWGAFWMLFWSRSLTRFFSILSFSCVSCMSATSRPHRARTSLSQN